MAIKLPATCHCGTKTLADHRGESDVDGAQHYDLMCGKGHKTQLHFLVTGPPPARDVPPTECPARCKFHT